MLQNAQVTNSSLLIIVLGKACVGQQTGRLPEGEVEEYLGSMKGRLPPYPWEDGMAGQWPLAAKVLVRTSLSPSSNTPQTTSTSLHLS